MPMVRVSRKEIDEALARLSKGFVKDSDFDEAVELAEGDFFAIVQNGTNKRFPVSAFIEAVRADATGVKCGTTEYWREHDFIPKQNEIIIYTDYQSYEEDGETVDVPGMKVGSGNAYLSDLVFLNAADSATLADHITNNNIHVTEVQKQSWDRKLNIDDEHEVVNETLIFNRN